MPIILPSSATPVTTGFNMLDDGVSNYWFHHKPSFPGLNPLLYERIISNANRSIEIWDPYFHATIDNIIFSNVKDNITIKILSRKGLNGAGLNYMLDVRSSLQGVIPNSKNVNFCIGVIDIYTKGHWDFHDRFLIVDNIQVYIIGASLEYNHLSKKSSGIYKIQNEDTCNFIISQFNNHWVETSKHPSSIQLLHP